MTYQQTLITLLALPARPKPRSSLSHFPLSNVILLNLIWICISSHVSTTAQMLWPASAGSCNPGFRVVMATDVTSLSLLCLHSLLPCLCLLKRMVSDLGQAEKGRLHRPSTALFLYSRPAVACCKHGNTE
ncbi:hypothetical protein LY78DRAFT_358060 [Colletotrichum sublineola]|nr:hypothetical protein LY78DRAFT_358060 [Colletotrichum sublineola]